MFKPSPVLSARLRLTTKQVNGGYYKGNRSGSMGSHTEYGGYMIDYRKVRHFNVPDLTDFPLTPFITKQMEPTPMVQIRPDGTSYSPKKIDAMEYLWQWKRENLHEYDQVVKFQSTEKPGKKQTDRGKHKDTQGEKTTSETDRKQEASNSIEKSQ